MPETLVLKPADLFFTRGHAFISKAIRVFQRPFWKGGITEINHVGGSVEEGTIYEADVIEALSRVMLHTLWEQYNDGQTSVEIWRPKNLSPDQVKIIVDKALSYEGYIYGWSKILLQALDYPFDKTPVFRRLGRIDKLPFCSYVWSNAYAEAGLDFGVKKYAAQPDDMREFCMNNPDKYELVRELKPLEAPDGETETDREDG